MLDPKKNRVDYGSQLAPPDGFELSSAVGTTYSLDLEALMLIPVSLFYAQPIEGDPDQIRYNMLDAITNASKKITLFCQKGQIKVPKKYHPLMAYWEDGIVQVQMEKENESFHPKLWVGRYDSPNSQSVYRLLITSRNLTFDESWDMAFSTMGIVGAEVVPENEPLIQFIEHLYTKTKRKIDKKFLSDLGKVKFKLPEGVESLNFHPIGIPDKAQFNSKIKSPLKFETWDQLLIVSPFLDKKTLANFKQNTKKPISLFSSKEALDKIDKEALNNGFEIWKFSPLLEQALDFEDLNELRVEQTDQGLHAKFYIGVKDGKSNWLVGSANCTDPAQERNIEFLVRLVSIGKDRFKPHAIKQQLTGTVEGPADIRLFEPYDLNEERDEANSLNLDLDIRKIKFHVSKASIKGVVTKADEGSSYKLSIEFSPKKLVLPDNIKVTLKPLVENSKRPIQINPAEKNAIHCFGPYSEAELSPYLVFAIIKDGIQISSFLLEMEVELPESRLGRIFSLIIDNKDKFLKYLTFLLTGEENSIISGSDPIGTTKGSKESRVFFDGTPLFEKMMLAASRSPQKLKAVNDLVRRLQSESPESEKIIDSDFEKFWAVFKEFAPKK
jgi:HKD family nuclease